jgi:hypothetical protein
VERDELDRLQDFLRRKLNQEISLAERARMKDMAYNVTVPIEMPPNPNLNETIRNKFGNQKLRVVPRPKKTDSSEIYLDDEYIAVLFRDDASGRSWTFEMAVLDFDLDPDADNEE